LRVSKTKEKRRSKMRTITKETDYVGNDNVTYDAIATLVIEDDGSYFIDRYDYMIDDEWVNTQERDWDNNSIEKTFDVSILDGKIEEEMLNSGINGKKWYKKYDINIDYDNKKVELADSHDPIQIAIYDFSHFGINDENIEYIEDAIEEWIDEQEWFKKLHLHIF
jgi:hypothetical protein